MRNWSPNQVTIVSGGFTLTAIGLIALLEPTPFVSLTIAAMLILGYALDAADGQLARLQSSGSAAGEWLDHTVDAFKIATIHLAVLVNWYRHDAQTELLWIPICFQAVAVVQFFTVILTDQMRRSHRGTTSMILQGDGSSSFRYSLAVLPTDYGLLCVALGLMFWFDAFAVVYFILLAANAGFLAVALPKWYREVRAFA
jgi:phosphatidylglycerophosphate synthase